MHCAGLERCRGFALLGANSHRGFSTLRRQVISRAVSIAPARLRAAVMILRVTPITNFLAQSTHVDPIVKKSNEHSRHPAQVFAGVSTLATARGENMPSPRIRQDFRNTNTGPGR